ncbi:MAG TPA: lipid II flippase MurJ [Candidatus Paceibacterota bacterium]
MVKKVLRLVSKEISSFHQSALILGAFTLLAQFMGLFRDRLLVQVVGLGHDLDVYNASFKIPDIMFALGASLISVNILIPFLRTKKNELANGESEYGSLYSILMTFGIVMVSLCIILFFTIPYFAPLLVPGFSPEQTHDYIQMVRIILLSPILMGLASKFSAILQYEHKIVPVAVAPVLYNVGIIFGTLALYPIMGPNGLALGVIAGALLSFVFQGSISFESLKKVFSHVRYHFADVKSVFASSVPRTLTLMMSTITFTGLTAIASLIAPGSISRLQFAYILQGVPLSLVGISFAVAAFPRLAEYFGDKKMPEFGKLLSNVVSSIIVWISPLMVLMILLRAHVVRLVFGVSNVTWASTRIIAAALGLFSISLLAQGILQLALRTYYAIGETRRPFLQSIISGVVTIGSGIGLLTYAQNNGDWWIWFAQTIKIPATPESYIVLLALAFSIGSLINMMIAWLPLVERFMKGQDDSFNRICLQVALALTGAVAAARIVLHFIGSIVTLDTGLAVLLHGGAAALAAIAIYVLVMVLLDNEEVLNMIISIRQKFGVKEAAYLEEDSLE